LRCYLWIAGINDSKIRAWNAARSNQIKELNNPIPGLDPTKILIWVHAASLGEYEQVSIIIDHFTSLKSKYQVLLTFFSPSGYEVLKDSNKADFIKYLPLDERRYMAAMVKAYQPKIFIGVKYEFWWNLFDVLEEAKIEKHLVSIMLERQSYLFRNIFSSYLNKLKLKTVIYTQEEDTEVRLLDRGFQNVCTVGDPRVDQVIRRSKHLKTKDIYDIQLLSQGRKVMIYGSVYSEDLHLIKANILNNDDVFHLVVPHKVNQENIRKFVAILPNAVLLSTLQKENTKTNILIVDRVGLLFSLYSIADICYIGGGFNRNIHSVLEPAFFGLPISIGPKYYGFKEIKELMDLDIISEIKKANEFLSWYQENNKLDKTILKERSKAYFERSKGASELIIKNIELALARQ
jgi:3-deoxy-D-manno-octulosonic-acid transferase